MRSWFRYSTVVLLLLIAHCSLLTDVFGQQQLSSGSKKAVKMFLEAMDLYSSGEYNKALYSLGKAIDDDPGFIEAYLLKGDIFADKNQVPDAIESYRHALKINPDFSPNLYYIVANLELSIGRYRDARWDYSRFLTMPVTRRFQEKSSLLLISLQNKGNPGYKATAPPR